jgi:beta-1,4-mannosyl-glycoprotein beta-1,4-N-acetylglucosaminyltransferase
MSKNKLVDCFPYFNEKEILELRIKLLYDYVDKFVITEANQTHSGLSKSFECRKVLENIDDPLNKVMLVEIDYSKIPNINTAWGREHFQRDVVSDLLHYFDDDSIFYFGDCDEILNPVHIEWICSLVKQNPNYTLRIPLAFLNCRANLRVFNEDGKPVPWNCPFAVMKHHMSNNKPSTIREFIAYYKERNTLNKYPDVVVTVNGEVSDLGWHFSWMGQNSDRVIKYKSYVHFSDFQTESTINKISKYNPSEGSVDLLGRSDHILKEYDISLLPSIILENENLRNYFLPGVKIKNKFEIIPGINVING